MDTEGFILQLAVVLLAVVAGLLGGAALARRARSREGLSAAPEPDPSAARFEGHLAAQAAEIRRLADATRSREDADGRIWGEVAAARRSLEELRILEDRRREHEAESWKVVQRLSTVLAGGQAKGRAGENVLREHLSGLPPGMLVTDLRVNGRVVEYALELPDGRRLPVDSKWSAVRELEALEAADDPAELDARARDVERCVGLRVREVAGYLDPAVTAPVAVAAVPDAAYAVLKRAHADAFAKGVVIVPYSTALPVLLFLYSLVARYGTAGDVQACLAELSALLDGVEATLENKVTRAATMLSNGADELRSQVGKARGSIARARASGVDRHDSPSRGGEAEALLRVVD